MSRPQCRGCHAIIRWITTPSGKPMPVDPEWISEWVVDELPPRKTAMHVTLLSGDGKRQESGYIVSVLEVGARQIDGYVPHWATCSKASEFRKPRGKEAGKG